DVLSVAAALDGSPVAQFQWLGQLISASRDSNNEALIVDHNG
ncbi:25029_t:CDS:1, partial [Gigaspora rosea]